MTRAVVAAIADENLSRHHQTPGGPVQILYHQMGLTLARLFSGPMLATSRSAPRMAAKLCLIPGEEWGGYCQGARGGAVVRDHLFSDARGGGGGRPTVMTPKPLAPC